MEIYDNIQKKYINYDEKYKAKFNAADNIISSCGFKMESIDRVKAEMVELRGIISNYKSSLKKMNEFILERYFFYLKPKINLIGIIIILPMFKQ